MRLEKKSPCKVNLLLNILGKRSDGFHALETVMQPVPLHDELTFEKLDRRIELSCSHPALPTNSKNLVYRAAEAFLNAAGIQSGVRIHLQKNIPMAAGLGGGSGNAATTFLGLNELFGQPLSYGKLSELSAGLGSDLPFFLQNRPARATGRGEVIQPVDVFPALQGVYIVLVHPGFGISTPWAYQQLAHFPEALNGKPGRAEKLVASLQSADLKTAALEFYNSLEAPALKKYPLLCLFQEFFRELGAPTLMSGSGSTTFAMVRGQAEAGAVLERFKARFGDQFWTAAVPLSS